MTPFPNGTGPANADTGPPAPHAAAGTGGTSAIGGAHGRPCLSGAAFRRFTLPALLGVLLLAAPLHAAYGTESAPHPPETWNGKAKRPPPPGAAQPSPSTGNSPSARAAA